MKNTVIVNGVPHYELSGYDWSQADETMAHELGMAFLSNDKRLGFVPLAGSWLMFKIEDYERQHTSQA